MTNETPDMGEHVLICDNCHVDAEESDKECWNCGHTTFVDEPGNAKNPPTHPKESK